MANINEFKGKTEEAITTVKQDVAEVKKKVEAMDKRIWLILLLVAVTLAQGNFTSGVVEQILAFGK